MSVPLPPFRPLPPCRGQRFAEDDLPLLRTACLADQTPCTLLCSRCNASPKPRALAAQYYILLHPHSFTLSLTCSRAERQTSLPRSSVLASPSAQQPKSAVPPVVMTSASDF
eukprot:EG_transcript_57481